MVGVARWTAVAIACTAGACSTAEPELTGSTRFVDRGTADAQPHPRIDVPFDATSTIDARQYYCNVPEPGPCCCDPVYLELRSSAETDASNGCEFVLARADGGAPISAKRFAARASTATGSQDIVPEVLECSANEPGWLLDEGPPFTGRLCPATCQALMNGEYTSIAVMEGCYSIACPPP